MSREEAQPFTSRELLRRIVNTQEEQGKVLATIQANMITGKEKMDNHEKEIKNLNSWMNGLKGGIAFIGSSLGIHFFKNGGL